MRLSCLGSDRIATPNLDWLAGRGTLFRKAFATDIPTQPSHTALFTGRQGTSTDIVSHFHPPAMLGEEVPWLPTLLRQAGCRTGAVDHLFAMKEWFIRGYDDYMAPPGRSRSPASVVNELAFPWLATHGGGDFFCFLHYWDAHIPYLPPDPWKQAYTSTSASWTDPTVGAQLRSRPSYALFKANHYDHLEEIPNLDYLADLHAAEVAYLDSELGRLFSHLDDLGILDQTVIVAFGDHGENMVEHDAWFDHAGLYDSVVHVPLIVCAPGHPAGVEVPQMVALVDVFPTVLELAGIEAPRPLDGRSLAAALEGRTIEGRDHVVLSECTWQAKRAVRTERWKYIRCYDHGIYPAPAEELYDLASDPDEVRNVAGAETEVTAELSATLDRWLASSLGGRPDPMLEVVAHGLPAVRRLADQIAKDSLLPS